MLLLHFNTIVITSTATTTTTTTVLLLLSSEIFIFHAGPKIWTRCIPDEILP